MNGTPELETELIKLEKKFWEAGADFYEERLTQDVLMVFPEPAGILMREAIIAGIRTGARWNSIRMDSVSLRKTADSVVLLAYKACARRAGSVADYVALIGSVYVREGDKWKLAFHQHTPIADVNRA